MMRAVILAGGRGTRLKPFTTSLPKPLMPIGGELPILELVLRQLKSKGFERITLCVNHMANVIMAFFENGRRWGIEIDYSVEDEPLGTIAPLKLIRDLPDHFLVMNGDVFTNIDYRDLFEFHCGNHNDMTVATYRRKMCIDFGEVKLDDQDCVVGFAEKPSYYFQVGIGVNILSRSILDMIPVQGPYGFDTLMLDGIQRKLRMMAYPFSGLWLDIGKPEDYDNANEQWTLLKDSLLPKEGAI